MQEPYLGYVLVGVLLGFRQESVSVALSFCCATWRRFVFDIYGSQDVIYQKILQYTEWKYTSSSIDKQIIVGETSIKLNLFQVGGIIRVGGCQKKASFHFETKHRTIRPKVAHFTHLIVSYFRVKCSHSGLNCTLATSCRGIGSLVQRLPCVEKHLCNQFCLKTAKPVKQLIAGGHSVKVTTGHSSKSFPKIFFVPPANFRVLRNIWWKQKPFPFNVFPPKS